MKIYENDSIGFEKVTLNHKNLFKNGKKLFF